MGFRMPCPHLKEGRVSKFAIAVLTLAICATPLAVVPVTAAKAGTSSGKHIKKHHGNMQRSPGFGDPWSAGRAPPSTRPSGQSGDACPGNARGIDCRTWPPPIDEDPDRKATGTDGG
jgi:hypothetical protein